MTTHLGIMTTKGRKSFRGVRENFRDIALMGQEMGVKVTVFTAEDWPNGKGDQINGYIWKNGWRKTRTTIPTVIYNRIPTRVEEKSQAVIKCKKDLDKHGVPWFNPAFFDKMELHNWLSSYTTTTSMLPVTKLFRGHDQVPLLLQDMSMLFLKPMRGKAGEGFFRLRTTLDGVEAIFQQKGQRTVRNFKHPNELSAWIHSKIQKRRYVIQEGISLATWNNRPFDLRLLLQKDDTGTWSVTGVGARVAAEDGITTHVPNGGSIEDARLVLMQAFDADGFSILEEVQEQALLVAHTIENCIPSLIGEMSVDIGVDQQKRIWVFEANSKPMKFDEPHIRSLSLRRLIEFAEYLSS